MDTKVQQDYILNAIVLALVVQVFYGHAIREASTGVERVIAPFSTQDGEGVAVDVAPAMGPGSVA